MISHAQNFEDVMLSRALADVEHGFYIDVGANDPAVDSVTRAFYERGWNGINIEPVAQYHRLLCRDRPHDVNLQVAAGAEEGILRFYEVADTGLSTAEPVLAAHYRQQGRHVEQHDIPSTTLDKICAAHARLPIHFLKIDVEGGEAQVLQGFDLRRWQPWILVIEATRPLSEIPSQAEWEPLVLEAGYAPVYFDGINRFYLAPGKEALRPAFAAPPNYFDGFVLRPDHVFSSPVAPLVEQRAAAVMEARTAELVTQTSLKVEAEVRAALTAQFNARWAADLAAVNSEIDAERAVTALREAQLDRIRAWARITDRRLDEAQMRWRDAVLQVQHAQLEIVRANSEARQLRERIAVAQVQAQTQLQAVYASNSWRVTRPMRTTSTWLRQARLRLQQWVSAPRATAVRIVHRTLRGGWNRVRVHPALANLVRNLFARYPRGTELVVQKIFAQPPAAANVSATATATATAGAAGVVGGTAGILAAPPGARMHSTWDPSVPRSEQVRLVLLQALQAQRARSDSNLTSVASHPQAMT